MSEIAPQHLSTEELVARIMPWLQILKVHLEIDYEKYDDGRQYSDPDYYSFCEAMEELEKRAAQYR